MQASPINNECEPSLKEGLGTASASMAPSNLIRAGNSGQGATASLASTAILALWNL
jgi:hypothetical protein